MDSKLLDHYVVDCSQKAEQIAFIQSQRSSGNEMLGARIINVVSAWDMFFDPRAHGMRNSIGSGHQDWLVNQILMELALCPN